MDIRKGMKNSTISFNHGIKWKFCKFSFAIVNEFPLVRDVKTPPTIFVFIIVGTYSKVQGKKF
jgi:hypothetical protein